MSEPDYDTRPFLVWRLDGSRRDAIAVDACDEEQAVVKVGKEYGWNPDHLDTRPMVARDYTEAKS